MRDHKIRTAGALLLAGVFLLAEARSHAAHPKPAAVAPDCPACIFARTANLPGVANFAAVTPELYRGGQPSARGFQELKNLGVAIDVNLRAGREQGEKEKQTVEALGIRYVGVPWSSFHGPRDAQVAAFLELLSENPDKRIFVHCREGRDRTGVMIAAFRIADQHWPAPAAVQEMEAFHFHSLWFHSWKSYVQKFPQEFAADAAFLPLRTSALASHP
jgi:tyrosine-protein phosphatase SIW14